MKEILGFSGPRNFESIWTCSGNITRKTNRQCLSLVFLNIFLLQSWALKKRSFTKSPKLFAQKLRSFLDMFFIIISIKRKVRRRLLTLHKKWSFPVGISSVNVTKNAMRCNWAAIAHETKQKALRMKDTFDFTKIVNNHGLMQGTVCKIVRFISHFSLKLHIFFKKYFISLCNVVYVYYKNKMSSIFCQGCLSAFKYRMTI